MKTYLLLLSLSFILAFPALGTSGRSSSEIVNNASEGVYSEKIVKTHGSAPGGGVAVEGRRQLFRAAGEFTYLGESKYDKLAYHVYSINNRKEAVLVGWIDSYDYTPHIIIPDCVPFGGEDVPVTTIADNAFVYGWGITGLTIGANVNVIGIASFAGTAIASLTVPLNVRYILSLAFNASRLESVVFEDASQTEPNLVIGSYAFSYNSLKAFEVPARLYLNDDQSFSRQYQNFLSGNFALEEITVNPQLNSASKNFRYEIINHALCSVTDNDDGKSVRVISFPSACGSDEFVFAADYIDIYDDAFYAASVKTVRLTAEYPLREGKVNLVVGAGAFASSSISELSLTADGPIKLSETFTRFCSNLNAYRLSENITNYKVADGIIYARKNGERYLVAYPAGLEESRFEIPDDVVGVAGNAFNANQYINDVIFPEGLRVVEPYAFIDIPSLSGLVLPSTIEKVGQFAFYTTEKIKGEVQIRRASAPTGISGEVPDFIIFNQETLSGTPLVIPEGAFASDFTGYSGWAFSNVVSRDLGGVEDSVSDDIIVTVKGNVVGSADGTYVWVYRTDGVLVGFGQSVVLPASGVYIVRCRGAVKKIRL